MVLHYGVDGIIMSHCTAIHLLNSAPYPHLSFFSLLLFKDKEMIDFLLYIQLLH